MRLQRTSLAHFLQCLDENLIFVRHAHKASHNLHFPRYFQFLMWIINLYSATLFAKSLANVSPSVDASQNYGVRSICSASKQKLPEISETICVQKLLASKRAVPFEMVNSKFRFLISAPINTNCLNAALNAKCKHRQRSIYAIVVTREPEMCACTECVYTVTDMISRTCSQPF